MSDDTTLIEQTAREMISRDGAAAAVSIARDDWVEIAKGLGDRCPPKRGATSPTKSSGKDGKRAAARGCEGRGGEQAAPPQLPQGPHREGAG